MPCAYDGIVPCGRYSILYIIALSSLLDWALGFAVECTMMARAHSPRSRRRSMEFNARSSTCSAIDALLRAATTTCVVVPLLFVQVPGAIWEVFVPHFHRNHVPILGRNKLRKEPRAFPASMPAKMSLYPCSGEGVKIKTETESLL